MLIACWSVKGGSGTTVVAAAHALQVSRASRSPVVLVDLAGDLPAVLGVPEPVAPGLGEWLAAGETGAASLLELAVPVSDRVLLVHRGAAVPPGKGESLAAALAAMGPVVVDCGVPAPDDSAWSVAAGADLSLLVLRPCYLALRRAVAAPLRPSGVVLISEPDRALQSHDVEDVLGVPVRVEIPWDAAIARAVDAGLLASRLPRLLERALRTELAA